jgi:hypothetical protein
MALACLAEPLRGGFRRRRLLAGMGWAGKSHSPGAADRGVAGIAGPEFRVDGVGDLRIGHALGQIFAQRIAVRGRLVSRLHPRPPQVDSSFSDDF